MKARFEEAKIRDLRTTFQKPVGRKYQEPSTYSSSETRRSPAITQQKGKSQPWQRSSGPGGPSERCYKCNLPGHIARYCYNQPHQGGSRQEEARGRPHSTGQGTSGRQVGMVTSAQEKEVVEKDKQPLEKEVAEKDEQPLEKEVAEKDKQPLKIEVVEQKQHE